jgi:hypothetical protein
MSPRKDFVTRLKKGVVNFLENQTMMILIIFLTELGAAKQISYNANFKK